jgi:hypothetical protein
MCKKRNSHSSLIASRPIGMLGYTAIIPADCRPCLQVAKTTCHYDNNTPGVWEESLCNADIGIRQECKIACWIANETQFPAH